MDDRIRTHLATLEASPGNRAAFAAAEAMLSQSSRWEELLRLYESRLHRLPDDPRGAELLERTARLLHEKLADPGKAEGYFRRLLERRPNSAIALAGLHDILESRGDGERLVALLESQAAAAASPESAAEAWVAVGRALEERVGRRERALLRYVRALRLMPHHREAMRRARDVYLALGRLDAARAMLDAEAAADPARAGSLVGQYADLGRLASERPTRHELSRSCAEAALALDPGCGPARALLLALEALQRGWRDQARSFRSRAVEERDRKAAARLYLQIAELHAAFDPEPTAAARIQENLGRAFLLWPGMPGALELLERQHARSGDWPGLARALESLAGTVTDRTTLVDVHLRLSALHAVNFGDRLRSLAALQKAASIDPARPDAAWQLAELLIEENRQEEAVAVLERHLAAGADPTARAELRLQIADLLLGPLQDPARARAHLEAALRLDPSSARGDDRLEPLLDPTRDHDALVALLRRRVERAFEPRDRLRLLDRLAALLPPAERLAVLVRALLIDPTRPRTRKELEAAAQEAHAPEELVRAYRVAVDVAEDLPVRKDLLRRVAAVLESLGRPGEAAAEWRRLLELDPGDGDAAAELEAAMARSGEYSALAADWKARLAATTDPVARRSFLVKLAAHYETQGSDPAAAAQIYRELLELQRDDVEVKTRLAAALGALERWEEQLAVLLDLGQTASGHNHRVRAGLVLQERLGRAGEAADLLLPAFDEAPDHPGLLPALERLLEAGVRRAEVAERLAAHHTARGDHVRAAAMVEAQLAAETDRARGVALGRRLASIYEQHLGDSRSAFSALARAFAQAPGDSDLRAQLEALSAALGNSAELAELYRGAWTDPAAGPALAARVADLARGAGDRALLGEALEQAVALAGGAPPPAVVAELAHLAEEAERHDDAAGWLERLARVVPAAEQAAVQQRRGSLLLRAGRAEAAGEAFRAALDAGGSEEQLLPLLAEAAHATGARADEAAIAARRLQLAVESGDVPEVVRRRAEHAALLEALGRDGPAAAEWAALLQVAPTDARAIAALERRLENPRTAAAAARALELAYAAARDLHKLARAVEIQAAAARDPAARVRELRRLAQIAGSDLHEPAAAFEALARALHEVPLDPLLRSELRVMAGEAGAHDRHARVLHDVAMGLPAAQAIPLERELAELLEKRLQDRPGAIERHRRILSADPGDVDSLLALHRLLRLGEDWQGLYEVCLALGAAAEPADRHRYLREAGQMAEENLRDVDRAVAAFRKLVEADPSDRPAALVLDRLYGAAERFSDQAWAVEVRREQALAQRRLAPGDPQHALAARELSLRLAQLRREKLGDVDAPLKLLGDVLSEEPRHPGAREALESWSQGTGAGAREALLVLDRVLAAGGEHGRRVELRTARLPAATREERGLLLEELRALHEEALAQPRHAFAVARQAFAETGSSEVWRAHLERLAPATGGLAELAAVYEEAASWIGAGDDRSTAFLRRAAEIREKDLRDAEGAIAAWNRVLELEPRDRAASDALGRLYAQQKQGGQLYDLYRRDAEMADTVGEKVDWLLRAADLAASALADDASAIAGYRQVLELEPGSAAALDALDRLYSRDGAANAAELQEILGRKAALSPARSADRVRALVRSAALHEETGDPAGALDVLEVLQAEAPGDGAAIAQAERLLARPELSLRAAMLLEPAYRSAGDPVRLASVLEIRAAGAAEPSLRRELLIEVADLREERGDLAGAFAASLAMLRGGEAIALDRVVRLGREIGAFEELATALEDELQRRGPRDTDASDILRILAETFAGPLAKPQAAAQALERLLRIHPDDAPALTELGRLYRNMGAVRELVSVLERRGALEPDLERRKDVYFEMANLMEDQLADRDGAIDVYRRILEIDAGEESALSMLSRLLGETQRWDELAQLLGKQVEAAAARGLVNEARELRFKLGRVHQVRLADAGGAVNQYRGVLAEQPRHPQTLAALEELSRSGRPEDRAAAAELLAPIYAAEGDHPKAVAMLEALAAVAPDAAARAALFRRVAEAQMTSLAAPEMALLAAGRALHDVPDDPEALQLALKAGAAANAVDELAALLETAAGEARTEPGRISLRRELARLHVRAGHLGLAQAEWRRLRASAPDDAEALEALTRLAASTGDVEGYLEALRARLARADDPKVRRDLLMEIAVAQEERGRDLPGALATYRRLLDIVPLDAEALARMDLLCVRSERWTDLGDVLLREERSAEERGDARARVDFLHRLAHLKESRLLDREGALDLYRKVLELAPAHADTVARLEAMLARDPGVAGAAEALEAVFLATQNWPKYAGALESRVGTTTDPETRRVLLVQLAKVREDKQRRPDMAFMALTRAFREAPGHPEVRVLLERAAEAAESLEELAALYEEQIPRIADPGIGANLALRAADLHESRLGDPAHALRWYERAREIDAEVGARALPALERLYRAAGKNPELASVLEAMSARESDPRERTAVLFRLGMLCSEKLKDTDRALRAYDALLEIEPRNLPALRAAEPLLEARLDAHALYANLIAQREADPQARDRLTTKLARVAESGLMDAGKAIVHHRELIARQPRVDASWQSLEALLEKQQQWSELVDLLRARLPHTTDPREINRLHEKLGALLADRMGSQDDAIKSFHAVLERDPKNRRALESLRDLHAARGEHDDLAAVLRRLVPLQDDARGVKEVRLELAETLASLGRREEAVESGKRVLDLEPHDPLQLARAEALFRDVEAWPEAIRTMELQAALLDPARDLEDAVALWSAVAHLWEHELKRPEGGSQALEKVLELRPHDRTAFDGLRHIYRTVADWRRYAQITERFVSEAVDANEKVGLLREMAVVHEQRLGQRDIAFAKLGAAFELSPHDQGLRSELWRLADEGNMHEELAMVYESIADAVPRGPVAAALYLDLARVQDEKLDDAEAAEQSLRKLLEFDPGNADALQALGLLFARRGQHAPYVMALEQKLEATASLEDKKAVLHEIARVYDERLHDAAEAVYSLRRALELDPGDGTATDMLAVIYRRDRRWQELATLLSRARDYESDPGRRAALQLSLAELHENELSDQEAALRAYGLALEIDPGNLPALDALERLYTRMDRAAELLQVYDRRIDLVDDPAERARILLKAAGIWQEKLGNAPNAIACLEGVVGLEPDNLPAMKSLEALLRQEKRWERLIQVLERHAALIEGQPGERAELTEVQVRMGDAYVDELHRPDRAEAAYQAALKLDPDSRAAAGGLARVYESTGNWTQALEMLRREARLAGGARDAVEIFHRIGRIHQEMLLDNAGARSAFQMALDLDPGHLPSIRGLRAVHERENDVTGVIEALVQEATFTESPAEKTRLYDEVGRIHLETRQDREAAARYYEEARRHTKDDLQAARALSEIYVGWEDWPHAEEVLDIACAKLAVAGTPESVRELTHRVYRLGFVCEKLGKIDKARKSYGNAYELDPTFLPASESYAHLLGTSGENAQALKVYQAILIHHRDDLTDPEVVEIHFAVGDLRARLGDADAALKSFHNALDLDPWHVESHRALVKLHEAQGDADTALEHRRKLMEVLDGDEKLALLLDTARVAETVLGDPYQAIDCLEAALRLRADDRDTIERLLGLYRQTKQGPKAAELLDRWLELPDLPEAQKVRALVELGLLYKDDLREVDGAPEKAATSLNAALDLDWRQAEAFQALESMLGAAKDWKALERHYVRMLARLPKEEGTRSARVLLYRTLAELYLRALKDPAAALEAYRALTILAPDDLQAAELYAELLAHKPGAEEEAIAAFRRALPTSSTPEKPVQQLVLLHARRKELDRSYVAAQVSSFLLGKAGRDEAGIIEKLKRFARDSAARPLPPRSWTEHLFHPQAKGPIGEILALVYNNAGALFSQEHGKLSVQGREVKLDRRRDRVDLKNSMLFFANAYKQVAKTLGMEAVELYKTAGVSGLHVVNTFPVCVVAGEDLFAEQRSKKELYYLLGKHLSFTRPDLALAQLHRFEDLLPIMEAAIRLGEPRFKHKTPKEEVEKIGRRLEKALSPAAAETLKKLAFTYTRDPAKPTLQGFIEGAEYTATRVGVLLGSDLQVVWRAVQQDPGLAARLKVQERQRDLLLFCMSDAYAELREALGLAVQVPT